MLFLKVLIYRLYVNIVRLGLISQSPMVCCITRGTFYMILSFRLSSDQASDHGQGLF